MALTAIPGISQAASTPGWRVTAQLPASSSFNTVTATGADDAWTAGTVCTDSSCEHSTLLIRHWTGSSWTAVPAPQAYVRSSALEGVSAVAATSAASAWILTDVSTGNQDSTAVLHWTGTGWGAAATLRAQISAAVAPAAKDAWAFGVVPAAGTGARSYAAHYNGAKWSQVQLPVAGIAASATSASDIWVIGIPTTATSSRQFVAVAAFNGTKWRTVPLPSLGLSSSQGALATGIAAVSATNVWAVGDIVDTSTATNPVTKLFLLHWNGVKWAVIKVPYTGFGAGQPAQDGHGGVWLGLDTLTGEPRGYILHYGNGSWTKTAAPVQHGGDTTMPSALAWIPGTRSVWGTGTEFLSGPTSGPVTATVIFKYGA